MNRVKAIKVLKPLIDSFVDYANITMKEEDDDIVEALEMAVEALDVPDTNVGDMIDRQMAIDIVVFECGKWTGLAKEISKQLKQLPPAQPENKWIPCCERLPEEQEWIGTKTFGTTISDEVYVTFESQDGQRFADHISFQNGKLSRSDEQRMKVIYKGAKPIAWRPLPEPYQGGDE